MVNMQGKKNPISKCYFRGRMKELNLDPATPMPEITRKND